jgi:hypothetical protein
MQVVLIALGWSEDSVDQELHRALRKHYRELGGSEEMGRADVGSRTLAAGAFYQACSSEEQQKWQEIREKWNREKKRQKEVEAAEAAEAEAADPEAETADLAKNLDV